jgi:hypothetical protein
MEFHSREMTFKVGRVSVRLAIKASSREEMVVAGGQMELLSKLLSGIASSEEVATFARLLNGPTVDVRLERKEAPPCGCRGKA